MKITFEPISRRPGEAWVRADGRHTGARVRLHIDGGRDVLNGDGSVLIANVDEDDIEQHIIAQRSDEERRRLAEIDELKAYCGYVDPPPELIPEKGPDDGGDEPWEALYRWFDERTSNAGSAIIVAFAEKFECNTYGAGLLTDGFFKRQPDDNDDPVTYD